MTERGKNSVQLDPQGSFLVHLGPRCPSPLCLCGPLNVRLCLFRQTKFVSSQRQTREEWRRAAGAVLAEPGGRRSSPFIAPPVCPRLLRSAELSQQAGSPPGQSLPSAPASAPVQGEPALWSPRPRPRGPGSEIASRAFGQSPCGQQGEGGRSREQPGKPWGAGGSPEQPGRGGRGQARVPEEAGAAGGWREASGRLL